MDKRISTSFSSQEERRIAATRDRNEKLRSRLLAPKTRLYGRDETFLSKQIEEKKQRDKEEKLNDIHYANYIVKINDKLTEMDLDKKLKMKKHLIQEYKINWDNAVNSKKQERYMESKVLAREIPRNSLPIQDDLNCARRKALQQAQQKKWVTEQTEERKEQLAKEKQQKLEFSKHIAKVEARLKVAHDEAVLQRRKAKSEVQTENKTLAAGILEQQRKDTEKEQKLEEIEVATMLNSDLLNENPVVSQSMLAAHRVRPDHYKGMSKTEVENIWMHRHRNITEKRELEEKEKIEEGLWKRQQDRIVQVCNEQAYQTRLDHKQTELNCRRFQQEQMREKLICREREKNDSINTIDDSFFNKFGQSHR